MKETITHTLNKEKEDEKDYTYSYGYDERGRIKSFTRQQTGDGPIARTSYYTYDRCDRLKSEAIGRSHSREYTYKKHGGLSTETCGNSVKYYAYDLYNRLKEIRRCV